MIFTRLLVVIIAIVGCASIGMGALTDHLYAKSMTAEQMVSMATAIRYHQLYSAIALVLAIVNMVHGNTVLRVLLNVSISLFLVSTVLFSGSIYLIQIFQSSAVVWLTPIGGMGLMLAWLSLGLLAFTKFKNRNQLR